MAAPLVTFPQIPLMKQTSLLNKSSYLLLTNPFPKIMFYLSGET